MGCRLSIIERRPQLESESTTSSVPGPSLTHDVQAPDESGLYHAGECEEQKQVGNEETPGGQLQEVPVPSSSGCESVTHADENEETVITSTKRISPYSSQRLFMTRQVSGQQTLLLALDESLPAFTLRCSTAAGSGELRIALCQSTTMSSNGMDQSQYHLICLPLFVLGSMHPSNSSPYWVMGSCCEIQLLPWNNYWTAVQTHFHLHSAQGTVMLCHLVHPFW
ncbi:hypothetical protein HD554DRAFT_276589 [Boletus coccyginus]|nr:hypothetical protein HD554DRAFT_276589 [Boletus coccyginus]